MTSAWGWDTLVGRETARECLDRNLGTGVQVLVEIGTMTTKNRRNTVVTLTLYLAGANTEKRSVAVESTSQSTFSGIWRTLAKLTAGRGLDSNAVDVRGSTGGLGRLHVDGTWTVSALKTRLRLLAKDCGLYIPSLGHGRRNVRDRFTVRKVETLDSPIGSIRLRLWTWNLPQRVAQSNDHLVGLKLAHVHAKNPKRARAVLVERGPGETPEGVLAPTNLVLKEVGHFQGQVYFDVGADNCPSALGGEPRRGTEVGFIDPAASDALGTTLTTQTIKGIHTTPGDVPENLSEVGVNKTNGIAICPVGV